MASDAPTPEGGLTDGRMSEREARPLWRHWQIAAAPMSVLVGLVGALLFCTASSPMAARHAHLVLWLGAGWGFVGVGLWAHLRDPGNRTGGRMVVTGLAWLVFRGLEA